MLDQKHGLYVLAARDIFAMLKQPQYQHLSAWIGFYEIYQGQLYDLLNDRKKLFAREDGKQNIVIAGLKEFPIDNVDNLMQVFEFGSQARSTGMCHNLAKHCFTPLLMHLRNIQQVVLVPMRTHLDHMLSFKSCSSLERTERRLPESLVSLI